MNEAMLIGLLLVALVLVLVALVLLQKRLAAMEQNELIQRAVMTAIVVGFKGAGWSVETLGVYLDGVDRAELARLAWHIAPPTVRRLMNEEQFGVVMEGMYEEMLELWQNNAGYFLNEVQRIVEAKDGDG